jgi:hypothetical protein
MSELRKQYTLTKREARKRAYLSAATLVDEACCTEIFEHQDYTEGDVERLLDALQEIAAELYARAQK